MVGLIILIAARFNERTAQERFNFICLHFLSRDVCHNPPILGGFFSYHHIVIYLTHESASLFASHSLDFLKMNFISKKIEMLFSIPVFPPSDMDLGRLSRGGFF
jgi:hypothetical protein